MRHRTRIKRLERAAEALSPPARCPTCRGPAPGYSALVRLVGEDGVPHEPVCPACGLVVDSAGAARSAHALAPGSGPMAIKQIVLGAAS